MTEIRKLVRDGKLGVVLAKYTTSYGWYTHHKNLQLLFLPELVELIESDNYKNAPDNYRKRGDTNLPKDTLVEHLLVKLGYYSPDLSCYNLEVVWLDINTQFRIDREYDAEYGYVSEVIVVNDDNWITA